MIIADSFNWEEIERFYDRWEQITDPNIDTTEGTLQRGTACLRKAEIEAGSGFILIPVNCGQQLYDIIEITDRQAGLDAARKRVLGITLIYDTERGIYEQRIILGGV
jgi:hypothetical protein